MALWWLHGGYVFPVVLKPENLIFLVKFYFTLKVKGNCPTKTIRILTEVFCTFCPIFFTLAGTSDELWCGQAQNGVNFDFKLDLTLKVPPPPKKKKKKKKKKTNKNKQT